MRFYKCYECILFFNCFQMINSFLFNQRNLINSRIFFSSNENIDLIQSDSNKLNPSEKCKTILYQPQGIGVLSTLGIKKQIDKYPQGSVVGFSMDSNDLPFFVFSDLSTHTRNLLVNNSASLSVMEYGFNDVSDSRVMLTGDIKKIKNEKVIEDYKNLYLRNHPDSLWITFGDFNVYKMDKIKAIYFVGGFGRANRVKMDDYLKSKPDIFIHNIEANIDFIMENYFELIGRILLSKIRNIVSFDVKNVDSWGINFNIKYSNNYDINFHTRITRNNKKFFRIPFSKKVYNLFDIKDELKKIDI